MDNYAVARARRLAQDARLEGRSTLLESAGFEILQSLGLLTPARLMVRHSAEVPHTPLLLSDRVVVKVVADAIVHKTDVGGVAVVRNRHDQIAAAVQTMEAAFGDVVAGYSIAEFVPYDHSFGHEWLLGMRWTPEFGPVVTVGVGGVTAEFVTAALRGDRGSIVFLPSASRTEIEDRLSRLVVTPLVTGGVRRQRATLTIEQLATTVEKFCQLGDACRPDGLSAIEINPLAMTTGGPIALDVLATTGDGVATDRRLGPVQKIHNLLQPRSIAIVGVSAAMNPGRIILRNLLREGFDRSSILVVKAGTAEIEGCAAVARIQDLPHAVVLAVLAIGAEQIPEAMSAIIESQKAESVIVIPGGLGEKEGTNALTEPILKALDDSRHTDWGGPVVNGGNCLGIQSRPGRYDTMFIPAHKIGPSEGSNAPLALITQSGAFAVSRTTRFGNLRPRYTITVGNQIDLTIGDYLAHLEQDPAVQVFGLYVEGFKPLDGLAAVEAVRRITSSGRTVILYRAGRTREGTRATATHTAAVAGDYDVTRGLFAAAGAIVADSLEDFTDLVMLFTLLATHSPAGVRVGAMSNAGYECVAIADHIQALELARFSDAGRVRLGNILAQRRLATLVDVHNPFDVTPMADDDTFEAVARTILDDPRVDVGVIGCVPATPALSTLPAAPSHDEDVSAETSVASRLIGLKHSHAKPFISIVDAGHLYDDLAESLIRGGIPTFRSADRAMRLMERWVVNRLADRRRADAERWVDEFSHDLTGSVGGP
jgi:acyl-CoA synthetase (NDP forming)